jgi:hypothetical protein
MTLLIMTTQATNLNLFSGYNNPTYIHYYSGAGLENLCTEVYSTKRLSELLAQEQAMYEDPQTNPNLGSMGITIVGIDDNNVSFEIKLT